MYFDYPESPQIEKNNFYTKSFNIEDKTNILLFFKEYGFVIIDDIITGDECKKTELEVFNYLNISDTKSFSNHNEDNIVSRKPLFTPYVVNNRQNKKIYNIYSMLLNYKNLLVSHDLCYFLKPTRFVKINNRIIDVGKWKTSRKVYLDINFTNKQNDILKKLNYANTKNFIYENFLINTNNKNINGLISITDNTENDGGISCVPGFHKYFDYWFEHCKQYNLLEQNDKLLNYDNYIFNDDDPIKNKLVKINIKKGSILLWDQRIPYSIEPNNSSNHWLAQKIRYTYKFDNMSRYRTLMMYLKKIHCDTDNNILMKNLLL
jgi:ectoine hydroxylase-related dioxygenase (phytanoyl-CoA dioxygenase family)